MSIHPGVEDVKQEVPMNPSMKSDVIGRVRNMRLAKRNVLLPLFDTIVNSIQAIEDRNSLRRGKIEIHIVRIPQQTVCKGEDEKKFQEEIIGFIVKDDGIGFDRTNFESFQTSDSRQKEKRGGKGIGRFLWLKAFQKAHIESRFRENGNYQERSFDFVLDENAIQNHRLVSSQDVASPGTEISLENIRKEYKQQVPRRAETIARRILEHCIMYFMSNDCPEVVVIDDADPINLNKIFKEEIQPTIKSEPFTVKNQSFRVQYLWFHNPDRDGHRIVLCAHQREVSKEPLIKHLPDLKLYKNPDDKSKYEASLTAYVSGEYLDRFVNAERTDFNITKQKNQGQRFIESLDVSEQEIIENVVQCIRHELRDTLGEIEREKMEQFKQFTIERPRYRPLLKYVPDRLREIPPGLSEENLDLEMHKISKELEVALKEEGQKYLADEKDTKEEDPEYDTNYNRYIEKVEALGASKLAEYVVHRKTILNLLAASLRPGENGKYPPEEKLHRILYPTRATSDDNEFVEQNLWIVDEKLTYHTYLASDTPFKKMAPVESESEKRPDILIFNGPTAFVDKGYPYESIVIVELKRPERTAYQDEEPENPLRQIYNYIRELKSGKAKDKDDMTLRIADDTRFYCYIIADPTDKLVQILEDNGFTRTPDGDGYYFFNTTHNAYVEMISYRKLLEDAKKRNRILFDKLGIPS